ncbi:hypothetical protein T439DRAFT_84842 [Meredithblackwellia eburnea MCA 4105]
MSATNINIDTSTPEYRKLYTIPLKSTLTKGLHTSGRTAWLDPCATKWKQDSQHVDKLQADSHSPAPPPPPLSELTVGKPENEETETELVKTREVERSPSMKGDNESKKQVLAAKRSLEEFTVASSGVEIEKRPPIVQELSSLLLELELGAALVAKETETKTETERRATRLLGRILGVEGEKEGEMEKGGATCGLIGDKKEEERGLSEEDGSVVRDGERFFEANSRPSSPTRLKSTPTPPDHGIQTPDIDKSERLKIPNTTTTTLPEPLSGATTTNLGNLSPTELQVKSVSPPTAHMKTLPAKPTILPPSPNSPTPNLTPGPGEASMEQLRLHGERLAISELEQAAPSPDLGENFTSKLQQQQRKQKITLIKLGDPRPGTPTPSSPTPSHSHRVPIFQKTAQGTFYPGGRTKSSVFFLPEAEVEWAEQCGTVPVLDRFGKVSGVGGGARTERGAWGRVILSPVLSETEGTATPSSSLEGERGKSCDQLGSDNVSSIHLVMARHELGVKLGMDDRSEAESPTLESENQAVTTCDLGSTFAPLSGSSTKYGNMLNNPHSLVLKCDREAIPLPLATTTARSTTSSRDSDSKVRIEHSQSIRKSQSTVSTPLPPSLLPPQSGSNFTKPFNSSIPPPRPSPCCTPSSISSRTLSPPPILCATPTPTSSIKGPVERSTSCWMEEVAKWRIVDDEEKDKSVGQARMKKQGAGSGSSRLDWVESDSDLNSESSGKRKISSDTKTSMQARSREPNPITIANPKLETCEATADHDMIPVMSFPKVSKNTAPNDPATTSLVPQSPPENSTAPREFPPSSPAGVSAKPKSEGAVNPPPDSSYSSRSAATTISSNIFHCTPTRTSPPNSPLSIESYQSLPPDRPNPGVTKPHRSRVYRPPVLTPEEKMAQRERRRTGESREFGMEPGESAGARKGEMWVRFKEYRNLKEELTSSFQRAILSTERVSILNEMAALAQAQPILAVRNEALRWWRESLIIDANQPEVYRRLGLHYLNERKYQEACSTLENACRLNPNDAFAWFSLGSAHVGLSQGRAAQRAYFEALNLAKDKNKKLYLATQVYCGLVL